MKKLGLFLVAYFAINMAWAYPWHIVWFHDLYVSWGAITREQPIVPLGITAIVIQGVVIGYLYPFYYNGNSNPILQGIKFNLIIGLMTYTGWDLPPQRKFRLNPLRIFFYTIRFFKQYNLHSLAQRSVGFTEKRQRVISASSLTVRT